MTGASLFGERHRMAHGWRYDKNETLVNRADYRSYTHLISAEPDKHKADFRVLKQIHAYQGVKLVSNRHEWKWAVERTGTYLGPIIVTRRPVLAILERLK